MFYVVCWFVYCGLLIVLFGVQTLVFRICYTSYVAYFEFACFLFVFAVGWYLSFLLVV